MKYKDGVIVKIEKFIDNKLVVIIPSNEIIFAIQMAEVISKEQFNKEIVVTSVLDSVHSKGSLHYGGNACDLRSYIYSEEEIGKFITILKNTVGKDYDIIFEPEPAHIHIEYDPK
jgi:hypothetical protein